MKEKKISIYPGTFDPITLGHIDIIYRASKIFDEVIVTLALNPSKTPLFSTDERLMMIHDAIDDFENVRVVEFDGLLVDFAQKNSAKVIIRGLRAISDFAFEFQMALMNRKLNKEVQSVFLMTGFRWIFTSSSIIKEAAQFGGDISDMVPEAVHKKMLEKYPLPKKK